MLTAAVSQSFSLDNASIEATLLIPSAKTNALSELLKHGDRKISAYFATMFPLGLLTGNFPVTQKSGKMNWLNYSNNNPFSNSVKPLQTIRKMP
jgi:hypothetical protein